MSNGAACCILGVCCPPNQQHAALSRKIQSCGASADVADSAASMLLATVDFVPKGVGAAIVDAYRPIFAQPAPAGSTL